MEEEKKGYPCNQCDKHFALKNSLTRHRKKHEKMITTGSFEEKIPENSPQNYKNNVAQDEEEEAAAGKFAYTERKQMAVYRLAPNTYLREFNYDRYVLQKGQSSVLLCKGELQHILDISQAVMVCMEDFKEGKQVQYSQNLGKDVYLSLNTPYRCIDIRKFWIIPATDQLHPTKIGTPLNFTEFFRLLEILETCVFDEPRTVTTTDV